MTLLTRTLLVLTSLIFVTGAQAGSKDFGDHTIHYSVFSSDFLSPDIAKSYGIKRSKKRAVLNISVTQKNEGSLPTPIAVEVTGTASNIYNQLKPINLREIKQPGAYYYIAEIPVSNQELITFNISAKLDGKVLGSVKFRQKFYTD